MDHIDLGPPAYDNSELMELLSKLHKCAKRHRDHTDRDILKGAPNDTLRQAMFAQYAARIDALRDIIGCIEHFQVYAERMADEMRGAEAVVEIIRSANLDQQKN